jgi:glycosyltransferase involved in cell wall biosynthesis
MRILHASQPGDAGVARVLAELVEHQTGLGWQVHVACPPDGWLVRRLAGSPVRLHSWNASRSPGGSTLAETRAFGALARRIDPDVVHLHSAKAGLAGRLALRGGVPTMFQPHAWSFHAAGPRIQRATVLWERTAMRWTDLLIAVSRAELAEGHQLGIRPRTSEVISNGVDTELFCPRDRAQARQELGLGPGPLVLCMGRLTRQKGQDLALRMWPRIRAAVPDARLAVVGDGPARTALARELPPGAALFGAVADPAVWFAAADVVALPSRWEGMALVPLEAMASGRTVVGFDVSGVAESVADAGCTVPVGDLTGFGDQVIRRLIDHDLALEEGRRGRLRAVQLFERTRVWEQTSRATLRLLGTGSPTSPVRSPER